MTAKIFGRLGATAVLTAFAASPAFAHAGDHGGLDVTALVAHFAQEPFHAGGLLAAIGLAAFAVVSFRKAKARQRHK